MCQKVVEGMVEKKIHLGVFYKRSPKPGYPLSMSAPPLILLSFLSQNDTLCSSKEPIQILSFNPAKHT